MAQLADEQISVTFPAGILAAAERHAVERGESLNRYIVYAVVVELTEEALHSEARYQDMRPFMRKRFRRG